MQYQFCFCDGLLLVIVSSRQFQKNCYFFRWPLLLNNVNHLFGIRLFMYKSSSIAK